MVRANFIFHRIYTLHKSMEFGTPKQKRTKQLAECFNIHFIFNVEKLCACANVSVCLLSSSSVMIHLKFVWTDELTGRQNSGVRYFAEIVHVNYSWFLFLLPFRYRRYSVVFIKLLIFLCPFVQYHFTWIIFKLILTIWWVNKFDLWGFPP